MLMEVWSSSKIRTHIIWASNSGIFRENQESCSPELNNRTPAYLVILLDFCQSCPSLSLCRDSPHLDWQSSQSWP